MPEIDPRPPNPSPDCTEVEEQHLADRYVLGQLTPEAAEAFEDHYMSCPMCVAAVERAELMATGFKRVAAEGLASSPEAAGPGAVADLATHRRRRRPSFARLGGLLAAALFGAVITLPLLQRSADGPEPGGAVEVRHLQPSRSAGARPGGPSEPASEPAYRIARTNKPVILALELTPPLYVSYRALLVHRGVELWRSGGLELGERDTVHLRLPGSDLPPGDHLLVLEGESDGSWLGAGRFHFRLE